jgi:hypothetical protein
MRLALSLLSDAVEFAALCVFLAMIGCVASAFGA